MPRSVNGPQTKEDLAIDAAGDVRRVRQLKCQLK
jgi:hypothetical protein